MIVNGKNSTRVNVVMIGDRCIGSCFPGIVDVPLENTTRLWSDPNSWTNGVVPIAGDTVTIESGWNMVYDVEESPIIDLLFVNGRLTF